MAVDMTDDLRCFAQQSGYWVWCQHKRIWRGYKEGWYIQYTGPNPALRALRDTGPYDNEADAWARAIGLALACVSR